MRSREGIPAAVIDRAGTRFGMPMGPIELADVVGLDVALHVGRVLAEAFERQRARDPASSWCEQKKLGRKSGEGFYVWRDGKTGAHARAGSRDAPADLEDRLILPMLNEAVAVPARGCRRGRRSARCGRDFCDRFCAFSRGSAAIRAVARRRRRSCRGSPSSSGATASVFARMPAGARFCLDQPAAVIHPWHVR